MKSFKQFFNQFSGDPLKPHGPYLEKDAKLAWLVHQGIFNFDDPTSVEDVTDPTAEEDAVKQAGTLTLRVRCNDLFVAGYCESEPILVKEIESLYEAVRQDARWGVDKWCCKHRGKRPQRCIAEAMSRDGSWDEDMEKLP